MRKYRPLLIISAFFLLVALLCFYQAYSFFYMQPFRAANRPIHFLSGEKIEGTFVSPDEMECFIELSIQPQAPGTTKEAFNKYIPKMECKVWDDGKMLPVGPEMMPMDATEPLQHYEDHIQRNLFEFQTKHGKRYQFEAQVVRDAVEMDRLHPIFIIEGFSGDYLGRGWQSFAFNIFGGGFGCVAVGFACVHNWLCQYYKKT